MSTGPKKKKRKTNKGKLFILILGCIAAVIFLVVMGVEIVRQNRRTAELTARKERLEQLIEEESKRREELDDEALYVQTRRYIEEKAKSIGYIYPDEIVFKRNDD